MAKVIAQHDIPFPDNWDDMDAEHERGMAKFKLWAQKCSDDKLTGETIRFQVADGYAVYGIVREKPLHLCHINEGDGYQIPDAHIRGLNLADVREMIRCEKALAELFAKR